MPKTTPQVLLCLNLNIPVSDSSWQWQSISGTITLPIVPHSLQDLTKNHNLCVTGEGLSQLQATDSQFLLRLIPHIQVFARVAPKQKVRGVSLL